MNTFILLVVGMGLVTYIPRMIPMVLLKELKLPPYLKRFLQFIPYTALGALIFPGILYSTNHTASAVIGGIISVIIALLRLNIIIVVIGGILSVYLWEFFYY